MFNILSLDGGGIRGAYIAAALAEIERRLEKPLGDYFDLVAGTSTGALVAAAVATGVSASEIVQFYRQHGETVFTARGKYKPKKWRRKAVMPVARMATKKATGVELDEILQTKYVSNALTKAVDDIFGNQLIGEITKCRLLVPAIDLTVGRTVVFKTPHLPNLTRDRHFMIADVLLATTAAPTYFPHHVLNGGAMVDGGLWANNPGLVAYTEAIKIQEAASRDCDPTFTTGQMKMLSIGTGEPRYSLQPPAEYAGVKWWGPKVFDVASISQSQGTNFQLQYLFGDRYHRINFELPDETWMLDSIDKLDQLVHLGETEVHDQLPVILKQFFGQESRDYIPFPDGFPNSTEVMVAG